MIPEVYNIRKQTKVLKLILGDIAFLVTAKEALLLLYL